MKCCGRCTRVVFCISTACPAMSGSAHRLLTIGILGGLDAHVGLPLLHARLSLPALLFQRRLGAALGVDVGQVGRGVVVGLHGLVVLDLKGDQHGLIAPLGDSHLATAALCVTHGAVTQTKLTLNRLAEIQTTRFSQSFFFTN